MKIRNKFALSIFLVGVGIISLLTADYYYHYKQSIVANHLFQLQNDALEVANSIDRLLMEKAKRSLTLGLAPLVIEALKTENATLAIMSDTDRQFLIDHRNHRWKQTQDTTDPFIEKYLSNAAARYFKHHLNQFPGEYGEIFLTNKYGALVASSAKLTTFAHAHKYWWQNAYNQGKGSVFFDDRGYDDSVGGYVLGVVVPIKQGTEVIGILKCNFNILGSISRLLDRQGHPLTDNIKLARSGGSIVYEKGRQPLSSRLAEPITGQFALKANGAMVLNADDNHRLAGFSVVTVTAGNEGYRFGGSPASVDHRKGNRGETWHVVETKPMQSILAVVTKTIGRLLFIGLTLSVALACIALLIGYRLTVPIKKLADLTQKIGVGQFNHRIDIPSKDEMGLLARAFNRMIVELGRSTASRAALEREIAQRVKLAENLEKSEERYRDLYENAPNAYFSIGTDGRIRRHNHQATQLIGATQKNLTGKPVIELYAEGPEGKEKAKQLFKQFKAGKPIVDQELQMVKADGTPIWINLNVSPIIRDKGEIIESRSMVTDISKRKEAEAEREKLISDLQIALAKVKTLNGLLPICAYCHKIRNDEGYWDRLESYIQKHSNAEFSHSICQDCAKKYFPDLDLRQPGRDNRQ